MSDALYNLRDQLRTGAEAIEEAHRNAISEVEEQLDRLDEYENLFDDVYDARDAKDYIEEMSDIFDDAYDAREAKDFIDNLSYEGIDDFSDFESFKETLADEIKAEFEQDNEELEALREKVAKLEEQVQRGIALEDQRIRAIGVLGGIDKTQAEIDQRAAEEGAYEAGLTDAMILNTPRGEQGIVDIDLTEPEDTGSQGIVNDNREENNDD